MRSPRRALACALAAATLLGVIGPASAEADPPSILDLRVTPLKNGLRAAVTWKTENPTTGVVYATTTGTGRPAAGGPVGIRERSDVGTEHLVVLDLLNPGAEYLVTVTALDAGVGIAEESLRFKAVNATRAYDATVGAYRTNAMIRFDWDLTDAEMDAWIGQATEFATRVNDMTDGKVKIADVILADSVVKDVFWTQNCALTDCVTGADIAVFTGYGFSRYFDLPDGSRQRVTAMWPQTVLGGIEQIGSGIEIPRYINRNSGDITDMQETTYQPRTGKTLAHEWGHYGLWLLDQYDGENVCINPTYDISIMASSGTMTEIDSKDTPCDWQKSVDGKNSWNHYFLPHYPLIGFREGPPDPGPNDPGEWFNPIVLNRGIA